MTKLSKAQWTLLHHLTRENATCDRNGWLYTSPGYKGMFQQKTQRITVNILLERGLIEKVFLDGWMRFAITPAGRMALVETEGGKP